MSIPSHPDFWPALRNKGRMHGRGSLGGFVFRVDSAAPYIATAIHAGGNVREELLPLMAISGANRYAEEDPETDAMVQDAASGVWGLDSRSEYDLKAKGSCAAG